MLSSHNGGMSAEGLDMLRSGNFDYVAADYIDAWPSLASLEARIKADPVIAAYEKSKGPA